MHVMGILSFLTGSRRERPAARPGSAPEPADNPAPGRGTRVPDPGTSDWNIGSLTAPPPEPAAEARLEVGPPDPAATAELEPQVVAALSSIFDPEIPVNIYELGLIYGVTVDAQRRVAVRMTLTSPACPSAQQLPSEALYKVKAVPGVTDAAVEVVWEPPWSKDMMSEAAKLSLGIF